MSRIILSPIQNFQLFEGSLKSQRDIAIATMQYYVITNVLRENPSTRERIHVCIEMNSHI